ncbi:MAG: hypothetical protein MUO78_08500 [candidate division Zixibacteria bacterium]|nr:hypothetical protein [candidate division Zixibacteria bacterium]
MERKYKRIYILTPLALFSYLVLKELILVYNIPYAVPVVVLSFLLFVILLDSWIKKLFLKAYNRFAYFCVFFLVFWLSFSSGAQNAKEKIMSGDATYIHSLQYYTFSAETAGILSWIFLMAYVIRRSRDYFDQRKYIRQAIQRSEKNISKANGSENANK